ncbi:unnamed protein product, partial [Gadus morhua 'NCC']
MGLDVNPYIKLQQHSSFYWSCSGRLTGVLQLLATSTMALIMRVLQLSLLLDVGCQVH